MKRNWLIHPFLLAIYPVVFLVAYNFDLIIFEKSFVWNVTGLIGLHISAAAVVMAVLYLISRRLDKAAFLTSLSVFLFFGCGYAIDFFINIFDAWQAEVFIAAMVLYLTLGLAIVVRGLRSKRDFVPATRILNAFAAVLIFFPSLVIAVNTVRGILLRPPAIATKVETYLSRSTTPEQPPDVYYLIFDRYANHQTLKRCYDYDNTGFLQWLEDKGFYVAPDSASNYLSTEMSLPSSLNLDYLENISLTENKNDHWDAGSFFMNNTKRSGPLYWRLQDYVVWRFLKRKGYQFVHLGSYWNPTRKNMFADVNINMADMAEFANLLYTSTLYRYVYVLGAVFHWWPDREEFFWSQYNRELYKMKRLKALSAEPQPKFVFGHFLLPHVPYVFDRDGHYVPQQPDYRREKERRARYLDQLVYTNALIKDAVEEILRSSVRPPVIIIQSDEGEYPQRAIGKETFIDYDFDWTSASSAELNEKMRILNAYYFPDRDYSALYPSITPVNSFRVLFNQYFGADFEILKDRNFIIKDRKNIYDFQEVDLNKGM